MPSPWGRLGKTMTSARPSSSATSEREPSISMPGIAGQRLHGRAERPVADEDGSERQSAVAQRGHRLDEPVGRLPSVRAPTKAITGRASASVRRARMEDLRVPTVRRHGDLGRGYAEEPGALLGHLVPFGGDGVDPPQEQPSRTRAVDADVEVAP